MAYDPQPSFEDVALYALLKRIRKKLTPAELTDLRLALKYKYHGVHRNKFEALLDESWTEKETRKETPKQHD